MNISSLTDFDRSHILGHVRAIYRNKCDKEYGDNLSKFEFYKQKRPQYAEEFMQKVKNRRKFKGCDGAVDRKIDKIDNFMYYKCLCRVKHPLMSSLLTLSSAYERGIMPFDACLMDQPAKIIDMIELVTQEKNREEQRQMEPKENGVKNG